MKKKLFTASLLLLFVMAFSQQKITGTILDAQRSAPLSGVNIAIKGTAAATTTGFDGKFSLDTPALQGEITITYVGFMPRSMRFEVAASGTQDLGTITLNADGQLEEVVLVGSGVIDVAKDRKTPVAVSTIKASEIQQKLGNQEFPEILNNTPSVYVTKGAGGFGDSRINIRGFDQKNIAVMVNGVPVNDMENSAVFWSNWAGISDVTSFLQVQRGLGSSKLAISSVGGTINIVTNPADKKQGGSVSIGTGNDKYVKFLGTYSTGKMQNGLSASVLFSRTTGDGYVDGTKFEGHNYYIGLGYEINKRNSLQLTFTGAPQWHNQRSTSPTIAQYIAAAQGGEPDKRYNRDFGALNGEEFSFKTNYYHKPVASLNWDFKIAETTKLSTVIYGSWGRGGGSSAVGSIKGNTIYSGNNALRAADGSVDVDKIFAYNSGQTVDILGAPSTRALVNGQYVNTAASASSPTNGISKVASVNSHDWYGGVMSLNQKFGAHFTFDIGADVRTYKGIHYQNVNDLLGGDVFLDNSDVNNPNRYLSGQYAAQPSGNPFVSTAYQQKIGYANDGKVNWIGGFTQLEYASEKLTAFVQGAFSRQGFKRVDHFKYLSTDPLSETDYEKINGGNVKGGVNYNINEQHNVFVNAGYYSKQPFFNAVYPNNASVVNPNLTNEKITGFEAGYGFRSRIFTANLNLYHTIWKDRNQRTNDSGADNPGGYFDFSGITEIHSGVELEMTAKVTSALKINAMVSVGNWKYDGKSSSNRYDVSNNPLSGTSVLYLDGVKVGDAAQTTASITAEYKILPSLSVDAGYRHDDKLYAAILPANFGTEDNQGALQLPSYGLMDAGASFKLYLGQQKKQSLNLRLNVNNVLNTLYISESRTNQFTVSEADFNNNVGNVKTSATPAYASYQDYQNRGIYNGIDVRNQVYFGFGRTWNFSVRYDF